MDLRSLMKGRGKKPEQKGAGTSKVTVTLPPAPAQVPDPSLKPNPDLKKKRQHSEVGEKQVPLDKGAKQQKVDNRAHRAQSVESREEVFVADVRRGGGPRIWSPRLELDGAPILWDTSLRNYDGGRAGYVAEALQQPLLLPHDMESYRRFNPQELFMSLKRDLAMVTQQVYVAEGLSKDSWVKAQAANQSWLEAEASLGRLKEEHSKVSEELKEVISQNKSLDAGLKNAEKQAEEQRKQLNATEVNLATERELVKGLRAELQKARENAKAAEQKVQLAKESIEAEKKAAYQLGADETAQQLTEQFASVCREYCDKTWEKALDAAGVPSDSLLRLPGSVYYENDIREIPVDESSAPPPHDASRPSQTSQAPPSTLGAGKETGQPGAKDQPADTAKGKDQGSGGEKKTS
ncbi:uncharacterized protein LOC111989584 [Quercus suber]|uniref:uncharacterized protein LOC111989584 n=2 Tax=Quercus suber TaxID=58331 RepID=UPI000CE22938|nr:uncharacterized protein LOC111989584 [Quercus suber]XP_023910888.1 uncharacterized protein LOC112022508 [Quercus suber]